jgi:hypothetical protein
VYITTAYTFISKAIVISQTAMVLCTVVDTVGVHQNYAVCTLTTSFIVTHPIISDQPQEGGREKLMDEIGLNKQRTQSK